MSHIQFGQLGSRKGLAFASKLRRRSAGRNRKYWQGWQPLEVSSQATVVPLAWLDRGNRGSENPHHILISSGVPLPWTCSSNGQVVALGSVFRLVQRSTRVLDLVSLVPGLRNRGVLVSTHSAGFQAAALQAKVVKLCITPPIKVMT